jgi:acetolactate synthase-1/2/3 large subunit
MTITKSEDFKARWSTPSSRTSRSCSTCTSMPNVRPPATGTWRLPPTPHKEPGFGKPWLPS